MVYYHYDQIRREVCVVQLLCKTLQNSSIVDDRSSNVCQCTNNHGRFDFVFQY